MLYFEPLGGIAGDMTVAALLHLGMSVDVLGTALGGLQIKGLDFESWLEERHSIQAMRFRVKLSGSQPHGRSAQELRDVLIRARLEDGVKQQALEVLKRLAEAEAGVHGVLAEQVVFHELGGWDTLVDIVGVCAGLADLGVERVLCAPTPLGDGWVDTAHGRMPVPAPAVLALMQGLPVIKGGPAVERTTPTGAALLATFAEAAPQPFRFIPLKIGCGAGSLKHQQFPNLLRAVLCQPGDGISLAAATVAATATAAATAADNAVQLWQEETISCAETNLDNANPEWLGWLMECLFEAGALDVAASHLQMKKNRPGTLLQVWYHPAHHQQILKLLFSESNTLGIRYQTCQRAVLPRSAFTLETSLGRITGKLIHWNGQTRFSPEFECCRQLALNHQLPLPQIYAQAQQSFLNQQQKPSQQKS